MYVDTESMILSSASFTTQYLLYTVFDQLYMKEWLEKWDYDAAP